MRAKAPSTTGRSVANPKRASKWAPPRASKSTRWDLPKCPTGIRGLDDLTFGGLPRGRATLVCGGAGSGKTMLGMEFLARGASQFGENGVFIAFEERPSDLALNTDSLGLGVGDLVAQNRLVIDQVSVDNENMETGEYDLDGFFIRLGCAIDEVKAKRVVIDTIDMLFGAFNDRGILRSELHRLFEWLKDKGVTTIVTAERGDGEFTRHGLEEYVSDCVIVLDNRVVDQIATRRLRVAKYRGSAHGTNEYPFLIDDQGIVVMPITNIILDYPACKERISFGVKKLDEMLGGNGFYRGSTLLLSGEAGTGKSSVCASFVDAACRRGERSLYCAFEEAPEQIKRNMRSIGINLEKWTKRGSLQFFAARPASFGLEVLIGNMLKTLDEFKPDVVVLDPISSFDTAGTLIDARSMTMRMIDHFKANRITVMLTSLTPGGESTEQSGLGISSLVDTWITLRNVEIGYERTRSITILKSRGTKHSNQVREFLLTDHGVDLQDVYEGPAGTLVGAARNLDEKRRGIERTAPVAEGKRPKSGLAAPALAKQKSTPQRGVRRRERDA